jgi:hypothetical protein
MKININVIANNAMHILINISYTVAALTLGQAAKQTPVFGTAVYFVYS